MVIAGAGGIGMAVTANTTIQLHVPDHLRGRVMSVYTTVFAGSVPAGGLIMGSSRPGRGSSCAVPRRRDLAPRRRPGDPGLPPDLGLRPGAARPRAGAVALATATADIGAIDPEGRSAGTITSGARPR